MLFYAEAVNRTKKTNREKESEDKCAPDQRNTFVWNKKNKRLSAVQPDFRGNQKEPMGYWKLQRDFLKLKSYSLDLRQGFAPGATGRKGRMGIGWGTLMDDALNFNPSTVKTQ